MNSAAATAAPQLPTTHASLRARRLGAFQAAVREGRVHYLATEGTFDVTTEAPALSHIRFDADGTITSVKADGTEKPGARIEKGIARDLDDARQLAVWVSHPEIGDGI